MLKQMVITNSNVIYNATHASSPGCFALFPSQRFLQCCVSGGSASVGRKW